MTMMGFILIGVLALGFFAYQLWKYKSTPTVGNSQRAPATMVLSMPPSGDSTHVYAPPGKSVSFTGNGFTTHCIYTDGHEGIVGDPTSPCVSGPMLYQFVRDTTGKPNNVTYVFN